MSDKRSQVRSVILSALNKGEFKIGSKLPTENEMTQKYGISRATVREGVASLVQEGILTRRRGAGTFVQNLTTPTRSKIIAAMVPCFRERRDSFGEAVRQIEDKLHELGYSLILCNHDNDPAKAERYIHRLSQDGVSGIIFAPVQLPNVKEMNLKIVRQLEEKNLPFVLIGTPISADTLSHYSFVSTNGFAASRELVKHLIRVGHLRIGYLRFPDVYSSDERFLGFMEEMRAQGLDVPESYVKNLKPVSAEYQGQEEVRELLALPEPPTAVMCIHDIVARNAIEEVHRMGRKVPEHLAVVGFGNLHFAAGLNPPLTTAILRTGDEADLTVKILFDKIKGDFVGEQQIFLNLDLVIRQSCGAKDTEPRILNSNPATVSFNQTGTNKLSETPL